MSAITPCVSIVMLTYNRCEEVLASCEHATQLPEQPRIIVVDNGSGDGTVGQLCARFPQIRVVALKRNIGAAARNAGVDAAATPYVAFCDDDCRWQPGALAAGIALLDRHPAVASLTARIEVGTQRREDAASARMARSPLPSNGLPGRAILGFMAGATLFRTAAFRAVGGYEPRLFLGGEEALIALDLATLGWTQLYAPQLCVHHLPSSKRDAHARRRLLLRNALWVAWLRRRPRAALRETHRLLHEARQQRLLVSVLLEALRGLPWTLHQRRPLPQRVEAMLALLERCPPTAVAD